MVKMKEKIVLSMGGSLIFGEVVDVGFFSGVKRVLSKHVNGYSIAMVCGGGKTAREYAGLARDLGLSEREQDILGIDATRLNTRLMSFVLGDLSTGMVYESIDGLVKDFGGKVVLCGGIDPGQRTDKVAALIASKLGAKKLVNITNVDGVFDKDPRTNSDAKMIKRLDYDQYSDLAGIKEHKPSGHFVFDHDAAEVCREAHIQVLIINGKKLENLDAFLQGTDFLGSVIDF